jgi:hypothetical protein
MVGGIACPSCASGLRPLSQLPPSARQELLRFSDPEWEEITTMNLIGSGRAAIRGALERYIAALLDRRLNLTYYLQELGH